MSNNQPNGNNNSGSAPLGANPNPQQQPMPNRQQQGYPQQQFQQNFQQPYPQQQYPQQGHIQQPQQPQTYQQQQAYPNQQYQQQQFIQQGYPQQQQPPRQMPVPENLNIQSDEVIVETASVSERLLAYTIDTFPFMLAAWGMVYTTAGKNYTSGDVIKWFFITGVFYVLYLTVAIAKFNTLGKMIMGIKAISVTGTPITMLQSFIRAIGYYISSGLMQLGFALALITPQTRALHDFIAGTLVIRTRQKSPFGYTLIFFCAWIVFSLLALANLTAMFIDRSDADVQKIKQAQVEISRLEVLEVLHKQRYGVYTADINKLAPLSGNPKKLQKALQEAFRPGSLRIAFSETGYYIAGKARDSKATAVVKEGTMFEKPALEPINKTAK